MAIEARKELAKQSLLLDSHGGDAATIEAVDMSSIAKTPSPAMRRV